MEIVVAAAIALLASVGVVLRRRTFPVVVGLLFLSYAVNLFLFCDGPVSRSTIRRSSRPKPPAMPICCRRRWLSPQSSFLSG